MLVQGDNNGDLGHLFNGDLYVYILYIGSYWENRDLLGTDFSWLSLVSFLRKTNYRAKEFLENYVARKGCRIYWGSYWEEWDTTNPTIISGPCLKRRSYPPNGQLIGKLMINQLIYWYPIFRQTQMHPNTKKWMVYWCFIEDDWGIQSVVTNLDLF